MISVCLVEKRNVSCCWKSKLRGTVVEKRTIITILRKIHVIILSRLRVIRKKKAECLQALLCKKRTDDDAIGKWMSIEMVHVFRFMTMHYRLLCFFLN